MLVSRKDSKVVIHSPKCPHGIQKVRGGNVGPVDQDQIDDLEERQWKISVASCAKPPGGDWTPPKRVG